MARPRLDVERIDAFLQAFDRAHGTPDADDDPVGGAGGPLRWVPSGTQRQVGSGEDLAGPDPDDPADDGDTSTLRPRRRRLRVSRRLEWGLRPGDLPPLVVLPGYRLDHRHHWRYAATGRRVPGARHRTLDRLWDFGRFDPVLVPQQLTVWCGELTWCATVGEWGETRVAGRTVPAWRVDVEDWDDRARYSLGMDAPELAADRLVGASELAALLGVRPSTVTSYLARGRLPQPQARLGGRPAWAVPVLLAARTQSR